MQIAFERRNARLLRVHRNPLLGAWWCIDDELSGTECESDIEKTCITLCGCFSLHCNLKYSIRISDWTYASGLRRMPCIRREPGRPIINNNESLHSKRRYWAMEFKVIIIFFFLVSQSTRGSEIAVKRMGNWQGEKNDINKPFLETTGYIFDK